MQSSEAELNSIQTEVLKALTRPAFISMDILVTWMVSLNEIALRMFAIVLSFIRLQENP